MGRGHNNLVTALHRSHQGVEDDLFGPGRGNDLIGLIAQAVVAAELFDDRPLHLRAAIAVGVFSLLPAHGGHGRHLNVIGRGEVRFAGGQGDNITPRRRQVTRLLRRGLGSGGQEAAHPVRQFYFWR